MSYKWECMPSLETAMLEYLRIKEQPDRAPLSNYDIKLEKLVVVLGDELFKTVAQIDNSKIP